MHIPAQEELTLKLTWIKTRKQNERAVECMLRGMKTSENILFFSIPINVNQYLDYRLEA